MEMLKWLRWKLAYIIAPDYFKDVEHRFSILLDFTTGGLLSKTHYSVDKMIAAVRENNRRCCDGCLAVKDGEGCCSMEDLK